MKALSDVTVLDFTHMLSGPYGTMLLADLGARTIKIEPIGEGEGTRRLLAQDPAVSVDGMGAYFLTLNRNKESVSVNLKDPQGLAVVRDLVKHADVVFENFSPGVMDRLGLGYEELSAINPGIISCSVSGFGHEGPHSNRPAFDMVAQAMGGGMSITGEPGGKALRAGIPIGDLGGGVFGALAVLAALRARDRTGVGQRLDISMLDVQISLLNYMATMYFLSGKAPAAEGNGHFVHVPYDTFRTTTRGIVIAVITDGFWHALVELLGIEALRAPEFDRQPGRLAKRDYINGLVQEAMEQESCEVWLERLQAMRIPCAPVNDFEHALSDPQILARGMVAEVPLLNGRTVRMPGNPIKMSAFPDSYTSPPTVGLHTDEILGGMLGMSAEHIAALREKGAIG
ncbi:CaiB/BaiF CoA transferase family protein [Aerobium aerolatum]|uniref:Crotonobetainyl-CoA:carnitine CoA-transferase CaiB n=1 Tax=Aquamicrobium aerolatum DSM 21857 TaxID=1121003 RepID=A0A1I3SDM8_9HYPH|nr:CaiB/BaiF CoA-transferase family protein [Aquamicrobium aerolatum]SFJ56500.1 Crotonobetainyl-CoA:carnitine CoA-transferase CaiB [Aquamicrobium aerolatum DSM 21857]